LNIKFYFSDHQVCHPDTLTSSFRNGLALAHYMGCIVYLALSGSPSALPNNIMGRVLDHSIVQYLLQWSFLITLEDLIDLEHITARNISSREK